MIYDIPLPRLLDQNMQETRRIHVLDASLELSNTPLSTAKLILSKTDTLEIRQWVSMYTEMGFAGIFRVRAPSHNYRLDEKEYVLDHGIAELGDYVIRTEIEIENTAASTALTQIFASYGGTLWQLGTVAATDTISYSGSGDNVLSALLNIMNQLPGYELDLDQSSLPWTVSVIAKPQTISGEGRLARNVKSCRISEDDQNLCTRIISPDLPNGVLEADTISIYGPVERYVGKAAETSQAQFEADCARYLAQHKHPLLSITIDLQVLQQITGEPLDGVTLGSLYRLALPDYNITQDETVERLYWPSIYGNPGAVQVTLANEELTLSSAYASASKAIEKTTRETQKNTYRWIAADEHITKYGTILHAAGLEIDPHGVWLYAGEDGPNYALGASFKVQADAISSEVSRATNAESGLSGSISTVKQTADSVSLEVRNARAGEATLGARFAVVVNQIVSEVTDRTNADSALSSRITQTAESITSEVERATNAESGLSGSISTVKQTADSVSAEVRNARGDSATLVARLTVLNNAITSEVTDRTDADSALSSRITQTADAITSEVSRATNAESGLSGSISTVKQTADSVSAEVRNARGDSATLVARLQVLSDAITSEVSRAENAESGLSGSISTVKQTADSVSAEVANARGESATLVARLQVLNNAITSEVSDRTNAESALSSRITQNADAITSKVSAGEIASTINQTAQEVLIQASKINLNGYVTASQLNSTLSEARYVYATSLDVSGTLWYKDRSAGWMSQKVVTGLSTTTATFLDTNGAMKTIRYLTSTPSTTTIYYLGESGAA